MKNIPTFCHLPITFTNRFKQTVLIDDFENVMFLALIMSQTDTLMLLDYCMKLNVKQKLLVFGFSTAQVIILRKQYSPLSLEIISFNEDDLSLNVTGYFNKLEQFFKQSYVNYMDNYR